MSAFQCANLDILKGRQTYFWTTRGRQDNELLKMAVSYLLEPTNTLF